MEAATVAVNESDEFTIHHLKFSGKKEIGESLEGSFNLPKEYCTSPSNRILCRQILFCVHVREDRFTKKNTVGNCCHGERNRITGGDKIGCGMKTPYSVTSISIASLYLAEAD
ncbi:hypothetical protein OS493_023609 [Desmophyllum pertusum]|uniref:Uncharacterized protein n=1 Tax=Desmophyllum pertusum TaxID=174260 RepID=A0A9W9ZDT8_9CNID|nr:hypothetical protein OS493_023609 [Desmophyllum pertusum]